MTNSISVGKLRLNPTQVLRDVRAGAVYTITDHGEPVAEIGAVRRPRWTPSEALDEILRELGGDAAWADQLHRDRATEDPKDPWDDAR